MLRLSPLAGAVVLGSVVAASDAAARVVWAVSPSLTVAAVHDDNIFVTPEPTVEDDIVRYTPGLAIDYTADALHVVASYSQDAEYYNDNDQFDSSSLRRTGTLDLTYQATERLSWGLNATYFKTPTPGELNLGNGLVQLGRTPTTRQTAGATLDYAFSPTLDGNFGYTLTRDETRLGVGGDTHEALSEFRKDLSALNTALFGYTYRQFRFNNAQEQDSHTVAAGWEHQFSARTMFRILAGPRFFGDDVEPYVDTSLTHDFATGSVALGYTRSETLLAGSTQRVETDFASLIFTKRIGNNFTFSITPAFGRVDAGLGSETDVRQLSAEARYAFNDYFSIVASYQGMRQEQDLISGIDREVPRDIAMVGLNFRYPLRGERE